MKKVEITLSFDEEKLEALEFVLRKEKTTVKKKLDEALGRTPMSSRCRNRCGSIWKVKAESRIAPAAR